ncbi:MAG: transposase family protein [Shimia sp.]|nr:transposase family protein [Shimia sp.]
MTATDAQVRIVMREREKGRTQEQAAATANLRSRKTAAKYEELGQLPSELREPRTYRTRADPFTEDWPEMEEMLVGAPELEAKALFEWLCAQHPGKYQEGQLRTFQRRVGRWRVLHCNQVAVLEQVHHPGEVLQTDGTWLTELGVTIQGEPFKHLLIHCVLPYSNWEWGRVAQSESLAAIKLGVQSTLVKLGYVPRFHQTDNSSAATHVLSAEERAKTDKRRGYTAGYLQLLDHYGMEPRTTHLDSPHENGDIESSNGGLKRALKQHLLLRGSCDFESIEAYEAFLGQAMDKRNCARQERLAEEMAVMKPLPTASLAICREEKVTVSKGSLIRVLRNTYSVPTSLIGHTVTVHIHEWHLEVYYGNELMETLPRLVGRRKHHINYRHLIGTLLRKPGGFRNYRYHNALFPSLVFRQAWEQLNQWYAPRKADLIYLRVLGLAARTLECDVAGALGRLRTTEARWNETDVERLLELAPAPAPEITRGEVTLDVYDQLLQEVCYEPA